MASKPVNKKPVTGKYRRGQRKQTKSQKASQSPMAEKIDFLLGMQQVLPCLGNFYFTLLSEGYDKFLRNCEASPAKEAMLERLFSAMGELGLIFRIVADSAAVDEGFDEDENSRVTDRALMGQMPHVDVEAREATPDFSTKLLRCMGVARKHSVSTKCPDGTHRRRKLQEFQEVIRCMQETFRDTF